MRGDEHLGSWPAAVAPKGHALPSRGPSSRPVKGVTGAGPMVVATDGELEVRLRESTSWMATK